MTNAEEYNDNLGLSLPAAKTIDKFEERLEWFQNVFVKEARRFQRHF